MKFVIAAAAALLTTVAFSQEKSMTCDHMNSYDQLVGHCEIQEQTIPYSGQLNIDAGRNGSVTVKGGSRSDVLVRMKMETAAHSDAEARALVGQIRPSLSAGRVSADGPENNNSQRWYVSYEIFVPQRTNLEIKTNNGSVHASDVTGNIEFSAHNGSIHLAGVNGKIHGVTTNGSIHVALTGSRWEGDGLDLTTTNGSVHVAMPSNFAANLDTATVNGRIHTGFPVTVQGKIEHELKTPLNGGGAPIRIRTTNGSVHVAQS